MGPTSWYCVSERIEVQFTALRYFALHGADHALRTVINRANVG
jgi:hypothetical protein